MKIFRYLWIVSLIFAFTDLRAGHEKGGVIISYESVGHITGDTLDYVLTGYAMYTPGFLNPPSTKDVKLSSSCFATSTFSLPQIGTSGISSISDYCMPNQSLSSTTGIVIYQDTVKLPGTCSDFLFHVTGNTGLYFTTTNINDNYSMNAYFYAELDNTFGPNSSPVASLGDIIVGVCANYPVSLFGFTEADGDSILYSPSAPARVNSSGTVTDFPYNAGYSVSNPVGSNQGYNLDPSNGSVQTQLNAAGNYIVTIKYEEFRPSTTGSWQKIGEGRYVLLVVGSAGCNSASFDLAYAPVPDPDSVQCLETSLKIATSRRFVPSSITSAGTEFNVFTSTGNLNVASAQALNDSLVQINLSQPLPSNTTIGVTVQSGTDGDAVLSFCGKELTAHTDTLFFYTSAGTPVSAVFSHSLNQMMVDFNAAGTTGDSLSWDFGDGSPSVDISYPSHVYAAYGSYTVTLISFNDCGDSDTAVQVVNVCDTLKADFNFSLSNDTAGFDASASYGAENYYWDFGDGDTGSGSNAAHYYSNAGSFVVVLTVTNACGDTAIFTDTVQTCSAPVASWTYNIVSSGASGMGIDFDATASQNLDSYYWDFGDGSTGTGSTVSHTFGNTGLFVVTLTGVNACGDSAVFSDTLETCADPVPDWTYTIVSTGGTGMVVDFDGTASQNVDSFLWDFDDGSTDNTSLTPQHTYITPSLSYRVTLSITNECGQTESYAYRLDQIGVDEWNLEPVLKMYPNPANDYLHVEATEDLAMISLLTLDGKMLYAKRFGNHQKEQSISTGVFPPGLYLVQVKFKDGRVALEKIAVH